MATNWPWPRSPGECTCEMKYFAYASNMHPDQMKERAPGAVFLARARLPDHTLTFPRRSDHWEGGVASFVPAPAQSVWGVVYEITERDKEGLDRYEGVRQGAYDWVGVEVLDEACQALKVMTYKATARGAYRPSQKYVTHILDAARHWSLPADCLTWWERQLAPPT